MANVDEHYAVVGVAELWEESLEVPTVKRGNWNYISKKWFGSKKFAY